MDLYTFDAMTALPRCIFRDFLSFVVSCIPVAYAILERAFVRVIHLESSTTSNRKTTQLLIAYIALVHVAIVHLLRSGDSICRWLTKSKSCKDGETSLIGEALEQELGNSLSPSVVGVPGSASCALWNLRSVDP